MNKTPEQINKDLLRPIYHATWRFYVTAAVLAALVAAALFAWGYQMYYGLGISGLNRPVFWAVYITNFVFWIGISHAGTLISAILRVCNASWRRPVTRCAEAITVFSLSIAALFPLIHLGRPWLFFWLIPYPSERGIWPQFRSPLLWDFFAINTYLIGSVTFLLLPSFPDFALIRDRASGWRKKVYGIISLGWRGTPKQWHRLEMAMRIMAVAIIPVAVSVHTIVSWDFAMAPVPGWHSTIFGPYFVAGAIFSGIAALIVAMALLRKLLHLEEYLRPIHFDNLGKLLLVMSLLWFYFVFAERLTTWYGNFPDEMSVFWSTQIGRFSPLFWTMVFCNFLIPAPILAIKKLRNKVGWTVAASVPIIIGMWLERFLIIVPSLSYKYLPYNFGTYRPSWVEIIITIGTFAAIGLLYLIFSRVFPIISIWELKLGMPKKEAAPELTTQEAAAGQAQVG
ncbi:MAG TPA: NrfD/PsrC family molybdoenzyme membrane anchor subunit [Terriglobia bacterium]|nr:NrfD/PsrC family molybdoenzyme membrane anchor subunit [Terriglobia bacterium]